MKKIISNLAGFILIMAIFVFSFVVITKKNLTVDNLSNVIKTVYHSRDTYSDDYFIKLVNGSNTTDNYKKYFNNEEIEDLYIKFFAEYVLYSNGVPNVEKPEFNELKEKVDGYLEDYETSTGLDADRTQSFKFFYDLDENMAKTSFISKRVKKVVGFVYDQKVQDITIAIILACIIIIIILNRDIKQILLHISSVFISNGVGALILKILIDKYSHEITLNDFLLKILGELSIKFKNISIICFAIGFTALLIFFLIKILYKRKDKPQLQQVTETAIPQYMTNIDQQNGPMPLNSQIYPQDSLKQFNNMGENKGEFK